MTLRNFLAILLLSGVLTAGGTEFAQALNYRIVVPEKATPIEKAAAAELKFHLGKSFSAPVKLNGRTPEKITFFIGNSAEAAAAGLTVPLFNECFGVFLRGDNILFAGVDTPNGKVLNPNDECGTFQSVAWFAQNYLHVKIFLPGEKGMKHAVNPEIRFEKTRIPVPSYEVRGFQSAAKGCRRNDMILFFKRRLGRVPFWARANYYYRFLNVWNKRFKEKPEMFALHDGKRVNEIYPRHFPCTSNPEVLKQVVGDITAAVKKNPRITAVRLFSDAPVLSCECDRCRSSAAGKLVAGHDHSEPVYAFFCRIAAQVQKVKPELYFHTQTKGDSYFRPPRTEKLPPRTVVAVLTGHFTSPDYEEMRNLCAAWRKAGARVLLYAYPRAPEMKDFPLMNPHRIAEYFKKFQGAARGARMAEGRAGVPYTFSALNTYVQSAVMFDVSADTEKLIDEFCQLAAPGAAAELKQFYSAMEKLLDGAGFRDDPRFNCYAPSRLKEPRALLNKALAKAPGNGFLKQLSADFARFEETVAKTARIAERYDQLLADYNSSAERRKLVKLSPKEFRLPFVPFTCYEDFMEGSAALSCEKGTLKFDIFCQESAPDQIKALCRKNGEGQIWSDDAVEFFFGAPASVHPYIHLAVNADGVFRAQLNSAGNPPRDIRDFPLTVRAGREKAGWRLTGTIPLSALRGVVEGNRLKIGIARHRSMKKGRRSQLSAIQKSSSGGFHSESARIPVQLP